MPLHLTEAQLNEPVTKYLRRDFTTLQSDWTVAEALEEMRRNPPPGRIIYFYVIDAAGKLVGVVPTRRLLLSPPEAKIREIMMSSVIAIPSSATLLEACEFFTMHRLLAFPIVDESRRMVGVIDIEAYTEELAETNENQNDDNGRRHVEEVFQLIGVRLTQAHKTSAWAAFRGRIPWLMCNVAGGTLAAILSGIYQEELNWQLAVLALFIPVVLALAESVAIQSVTLALDTFRHGKPSWKQLWRHLRSETLTGLLLGLSTGLMVATIAVVWQGHWELLAIVGGGIGIGVTGAAICGMTIPYLLRIFRCDPQVAAGPIALTSADMIVLLVYFNLARLLI